MATSLAGKVVGGALAAGGDHGVAHRAVVCGLADDDARLTLEANGMTVLVLAVWSIRSPRGAETSWT